MKFFHNEYIEAVCSQGLNGLPLRDVWAKLESPSPTYAERYNLCTAMREALWAYFIQVPGFQYLSESGTPQDPSVLSLEECESLNLRIIAPEHLLNSFIGIYDSEASSSISQQQRRVLERLAVARTNGITQSELAKEFGIKGNNMFYILKGLECRGLIVRQSTIVRKKESSSIDREPKNSSIVNTNMVYLTRYAKPLGILQRLEITREEKRRVNNEGTSVSGVAVVEECSKEDVRIKDYLPAVKAICEKLEKADGKVLIVSDIKRDLGYRRSSGHKSWRNICNRLKDAQVVEEFSAKVNKKEVSCLRLLKEFSPKNFEAKTIGCAYDNVDSVQSTNFVRRGQITERVVELPIERQVYDMIDAEGSKGLTITEVCRRLGLSNKRYYTRLLNLFSRFGMHLQAESCNRGVAYRVWTPGNFNAAETSVPIDLGNTSNGNSVHNLDTVDVDYSEKSAPAVDEIDYLASQSEDGVPNGSQIMPTESDPICAPQAHEILTTRPSTMAVVATDEISTVVSTSSRRRSYQTYPCLTLCETNVQKVCRMLEVLQDQKFMIKAELHRHIEILEKGKNRVMDRKTLDRCLNKLQQEGHCKCIRVGVPVVSNYGRTRTTDVVLHPSISDISPELSSQIHERLRSFEMQVRHHSSSHVKTDQPIPVLNEIQRILKSDNLDLQSDRLEEMRANGFVLAKMVRTKLLHIYIWGYLYSSHTLQDVVSSGKYGHDQKNPHSSCKLFDLDAAIKNMPLELFLQVVGSNQKFNDMIDKCRRRLCLSDLPVQEYKCLMNTRAVGRLSWLVDIIRRLKLIRLVSSGHNNNVLGVPHATLTHALELKPYIEEPASVFALSSGISTPDLRPQIRHDFFLSSRKVVDEYWSVLEYCYAAADSTTASHAFPGCSAHEVFFARSWVSVRVMTSEQRSELIKRVLSDGSSKNLSHRECEKISKDLNLTLEQVLRVYYDKRQQRLTRGQGAMNVEGECFQQLRSRNTSRNTSDGQKLQNLSDANDNCIEFVSSTVLCKNLLGTTVDNHVKTVECPESNEQNEDDCTFVQGCSLTNEKLAPRSKFSWTERADRQLVIEYVRHRAALGANFHRADWASLPNLPAPPVTCKRRMALLNSNIQFRKAVMRLCNMLSKRYALYLEKLQNKCFRLDNSRLVRESHLREDYDKKQSEAPEDAGGSDPDERWDNFDEKSIKEAFFEVLQYKRMAKLEVSEPVTSASDERSGLNNHAEHACMDFELASTSDKEVQNQEGRKVSRRRLSSRHLPRRYVKLFNEGSGIVKQAYESLAVCNAAELFKLIFLSTSTAPGVANVLAETLRRYSEHDLFAAFNYLREKKIMVGGNSGSPFALSQQFSHNITSSPFPISTGRRASKLSNWLNDRQKDLMEEELELSADLQCGDVFHLFALISSGEWSITPCLPDEGIGEAEDSRTSKRKFDSSECNSDEKAKKSKTFLTGESEIISRREKGFPGIHLFLSRTTISGIDAVESFKNLDHLDVEVGESDQYERDSFDAGYNLDQSGHMYSTSYNSCSAIPTAESPWKAMAFYAKQLVTSPSNVEHVNIFHPECFRNVYSAIHKAGDQGLTFEEIAQVVDVRGENISELIVEVLEQFQHALKVDAYDSVRVVDSLYRSKYFLKSVGNIQQHTKDVEPMDSEAAIDDQQLVLNIQNHDNRDDSSKNVDEVHKVTILNLPEQVALPLDKAQSSDDSMDHMSLDTLSQSYKPILPWVNGDGTTNQMVYKGLVRRMLGIVMQNPGILEDGILSQMHALNPQGCRKLLGLMIMDNHIIVRKMHQATTGAPPGILSGLLGSSFKKSKSVCREHFFANPMSTALL